MSLLSVPVESKYVTEECIRELKNAGGNFKLQNISQPVDATRFIYELCWSMVRGELSFSKCKAALESVEYFPKEAKDDIPSILADTLAHMGQELTLPGEWRGRLLELAKWLVEAGLLPVRLLQERCEAEFLWESEMIKIKATELKAKEVRVNTRLLYQQTKFNLLREESEGYAKLVTLLCQLGSGELMHRSTSATISTLKSLIGHFDLDPNRVFDIVLECFELQPENNTFLELIPIFPKSHAAHILGFKFQYYQRPEINEAVPDSLYRLTAALVKADFIDLDCIYSHLLPKDEEAFEHYEEFSKRRLEEVNRIGKINLAATGKDLMEEEKPGDVTIDLFSALDMEMKSVSERLGEFTTNQKLGLLKGFLSINDWYHAHLLLERLSPLNPVEHKPICDGLTRCIERSISPSYALLKPIQMLNNLSRHGDASSNVESVSKHVPLINLSQDVFQMLACIGPYLHRDTLLLQKLCRVLKAYYSSALASVASNGQDGETCDGQDHRVRVKEARLNVEEALGTCLLPSLQLIPANPAVDLEIWELLSLLPYEVRYRLYGEWEKEDERNPLLLAARLTAKLDTRRILKRLAKENLKQLGRMVAKLAHANPMTVLRTIVHLIEAYKDMITPVVDAFKYLTQLEYDILEYVVIERLALVGREKLKDDGLNLSDWLQSLASFWGHLCKKYPSMELRGLFQYLVNQLKRGEGIELLVLQELIQQMANVQYTENMAEEQLDALAGGEALRYQATSFGITRNNKALVRSTNRLRDALLPKDEPKLALPLLLLIAQHRSIIVNKVDAPYIKIVSEQFDRCHGTLLQYVEFLTSAVTPVASYAQLIPTLDDLVHKYHIEPEVAFLIYRPIMRLFKSSKEAENGWPYDMSKSRGPTESNKGNGHSDTSCELVLDIGSNRQRIEWSSLLATVRSMLPAKSWNSLSPELYITFWGLTLYDLYIPRKRYESEIAKQQAALRALEEISDTSHNAIAKRKKEKERIQELLDRLTNELQKQEQNVAAVHQRLVYEKDYWLTSCPDSLKINMEFLQRCIFPRCVLSMTDAVYCAKFVCTLHALGTPFFNTVNHIDVLICKALTPMICCCTEYEASRLGRFLYETLKMAYYWKSDEAIYERECGNMPGFAVYYRDPNSQRVTFAQYIKVHWKWSGRITRLLMQCLESNEYMDIRNALIILTKISNVFPVLKKSGISLEKRVIKIKADAREDLKVLATGVAAALAARKSSWISEEEFGMGYVDIKPSTSAKGVSGMPLNITTTTTTTTATVSPSQLAPSRTHNVASNPEDSGALLSDQITRNVKTLNADGRPERHEIAGTNAKAEHQTSSKSVAVASSTDVNKNLNMVNPQMAKSAASGSVKKEDDLTNVGTSHASSRQEETTKAVSKTAATEAEARSQTKRLGQPAAGRQSKSESAKDESKSGKASTKVTSGGTNSDKEIRPNVSLASGHGGLAAASAVGKLSTNSAKVLQEPSTISETSNSDAKWLKEHDTDGNGAQETGRALIGCPSHLEDSSQRATDDTLKQQKRASTAEEVERSSKRRKSDTDDKAANHSISDEHVDRDPDRTFDRSKEKAGERVDREHKSERSERSDKSRSDDYLIERTRDRSLERLREKSADRIEDRADRAPEKADRVKDDRSKTRHSESSLEKPHPEDRFPMQALPPPPPLPPNIVPQSLPVGRREDEADRRVTTTRSVQRISPRREEKSEKKRPEEAVGAGVDEGKRRREEEHRKRDEREGLSLKNEKDRDKNNLLKEEADAAAASKRRRIKRDHLSSEAVGNYGPTAPQVTQMSVTASQPFDARERERKESLLPRGVYPEEVYEKVPRVHKDTSKVPRREHELPYNRDWEDEKRQRNDPKRRHHRK